MARKGEITFSLGDFMGSISFPTYCRNNADKIKWLALKLGRVSRISSKDKVRYDPSKDEYVLEVD